MGNDMEIAILSGLTGLWFPKTMGALFLLGGFHDKDYSNKASTLTAPYSGNLTCKVPYLEGQGDFRL